MRRSRSLLALAVPALLVATGCGGSSEAATPAATTTAPTTSTTVAPTTTTAAPAPTAPLTGLAPSDDAVLARPAVVVKVDNHDAEARPQVGLDVADVVYEEVVEGGATRFAAVFHSTGSDPVGPVRSARTTDLALVANLHRPVFAWSSANRGVARAVAAAPLVDLGWDALPDGYRRQRGRRAPHNLFTTTTELWASAPADAVAPPALFTYRADGTPPGGEAVTGVAIDFGGHADVQVRWRWDPALGGWARSQEGRAHTVASGAIIAPENVVVQFADYVDSGYADSTGAASPEAELVGSGEAWILTGGTLQRATWTRPTAEAVTTYTDGSGQPIGLAPGRTWVELPRPGQAEVLP